MGKINWIKTAKRRVVHKMYVRYCAWWSPGIYTCPDWYNLMSDVFQNAVRANEYMVTNPLPPPWWPYECCMSCSTTIIVFITHFLHACRPWLADRRDRQMKVVDRYNYTSYIFWGIRLGVLLWRLLSLDIYELANEFMNSNVIIW